LKSTLVVPVSSAGPSSASGSTSSRAYTPQQAEKLSNRSRSPLLVTTGSAARRTAASIPGGT
jgi:hypothetical protein